MCITDTGINASAKVSMDIVGPLKTSKNNNNNIGAPLAILSDDGKNFYESNNDAIFRIIGVRKYNTSTYHPQGNSVLERSHHNLNDYIPLYISIRISTK